MVSKNKDIIIEGYRDPTNGLWRFLLHCPFQNNKQASFLEPQFFKTQYKNGSTSPQSISPNIPERLSSFLRSDPLISNQTDPAPGNQGWILLNMARTHREANFKVSPRIRDHRKRAPVSAETTTSGSSSGKCNTFIHQSRGEHK